jgi:hypothetical protein
VAEVVASVWRVGVFGKQHAAGPRLSELSQVAKRAEQEEWALREAIKVLEQREAAAMLDEVAD